MLSGTRSPKLEAFWLIVDSQQQISSALTMNNVAIIYWTI